MSIICINIVLTRWEIWNCVMNNGHVENVGCVLTTNIEKCNPYCHSYSANARNKSWKLGTKVRSKKWKQIQYENASRKWTSLLPFYRDSKYFFNPFVSRENSTKNAQNGREIFYLENLSLADPAERTVRVFYDRSLSRVR